MNIAVFIKKTTLHDGYGGLETQNKALCDGFAKRGHNVTVFSPKNGKTENEISENNVKYVFVDSVYRSLAGFGFIDKKNWINRSVEKFLEYHNTDKFDIVISQSSAGLGIIRKKNTIKIKVISICHGSTLGELRTTFQSIRSVKDLLALIPKLGYYALNYFGRQREFVLHSDYVVAVSEFVKRSIINETSISEKKIEVIYNGLDLAPVKSDKSSEITIIYVGLIHWSKGMLDLLKAVEALDDINFKTLLIGSGPHLEELRTKIKVMGLEDKVQALGKIPNTEAIEYMKKSSIFVLPSRRVEGFPVSLVEAMFCALPIVASDIGGISESVKDGFSGILYKPKDVLGLQQSLKALILDAEKRAKMGENGLRFASEMFTLDVMLNKYEQIMEEVLI